MFNNTNNIQNKPPAFPLSQPLAPEHNEYNWSINDCSWKSTNEISPNAVMLFNGLSINNATPPSPVPVPSTSGVFRQPRIKRKSESDDVIPSKHYVSEEKMIAHMNGLHLSDNFQTHNVSPEVTEESEMETYNVNLSPQELEQRLKNAQRIIVCDQVRKSLQEDTEIIPKVLLSRIEQPCRALVLWRPPESVMLLTGIGNNTQDNTQEEDEVDMDGNNNNNNNDPNNNMDMDL